MKARIRPEPSTWSSTPDIVAEAIIPLNGSHELVFELDRDGSLLVGIDDGDVFHSQNLLGVRLSSEYPEREKLTYTVEVRPATNERLAVYHRGHFRGFTTATEIASAILRLQIRR